MMRAAVQGACDIVAERWSEDVPTRSWLVEQAHGGRLVAQVKRGKNDAASKFAMYFDHAEPVARVPSHRLLAMMRGEAEGVLHVGVQLHDEVVLDKLKRQLVRNPSFAFHADLLRTVEDCYTRLLLPATESAMLQQLKEAADEEAVAVFARNLRDLLLAPPAGPKVTIGIDPGFRTGCKVAVVDGTGKFLASTTIYPTAPHNDVAGAADTLQDIDRQARGQLIAIGNGTAGPRNRRVREQTCCNASTRKLPRSWSANRVRRSTPRVRLPAANIRNWTSRCAAPSALLTACKIRWRSWSSSIRNRSAWASISTMWIRLCCASVWTARWSRA